MVPDSKKGIQVDTDKKSDPSKPAEGEEPQAGLKEAGGEDAGVRVAEDTPPETSADDPEPVDASEDDRGREADDPGPEGAPEPAPEPAATPQPRPAAGGFGAALLGGVLAAALGFVLARTEILDPILPEAWRGADAAAQIAPVSDAVQANAAALRALEAQIAAIPRPDLAPVQSAVGDLSDRLEAVAGQVPELSIAIGALETRLTEVEKRPLTEAVSPDAIAAYEQELDRLRAAVTEQRGEVEALLAEARAMDASASDAARRATAQTALAHLRAALDSGAAFADTAAQIADAGFDLPAPLPDVAGEGVSTLASLRAAFPPAARNALALARAEGTTGGAQGLGAFLQRQLGARSVEPREGGDADAILSRAEAALTNGNLGAALTEIDTLPEAARPALAEWVATAKRRNDAVTAAATLAGTLAKE